MAPEVEPWFLKSRKPISLPRHQALGLSDEDFVAFVKNEVTPASSDEAAQVPAEDGILTVTTDPSISEISTPPSTTVDLLVNMVDMDISATPDGKVQPDPSPEADVENKMLTENGDVAYRSTTNALVDLFQELEEVVSELRLVELLNHAWSCDPEATLKIIFNARSIHLGKSSRHVFYRCAGWLFKRHPATLITNLAWLSRPVIEKKVEKKDDEDSERPVLVEVAETDENDPAHHDVRNGVSHGYWKDLLNILALAVNGKLDYRGDPKDILNVDKRKDSDVKKTAQSQAKEKRHETSDSRHKNAVDKFQNDANYRALHLAVARLFAAQLKTDLARLRSEKTHEKSKISLCAKWAPSAERFHDKHTYIASTIAELLSCTSTVVDQVDHDREKSLRHARESYRKEVSALRKHLEVVERDLTANKIGHIHYDRIPSIAMQNYAPVFLKKDEERFDAYITKVAEGSARISGAVLPPSAMIKAVRLMGKGPAVGTKRKSAMVQHKIAEMQSRVADVQWKTLVQRIRDSGTLESSLAVCDVSGSMEHPVFPDGTCPMDSAIGLSLLVAEVGKPPFNGSFITFSDDPSIQPIDLEASLSEKVAAMVDSNWGMSTDFTAVFERLILPMALEKKIKKEEMVKRVFVFSDMQFNEAEMSEEEGSTRSWSTSYERIQKAYSAAGYEMPELVFWNLAGGRAGVMGAGDPTAPKPVTADQEGTSLVSGYSQGMLKVFLDGGGFQDPADDDDEGVVEIVKGEEDDELDVVEHKKRKQDSLDIVRKAISHKAYSMLKVMD